MANCARIAIIGNCQAQTLTSLSITLDLPVDPVVLPAVFDRASFDDDHIRQTIESCDYVFNQLVSDSFPVEFVRPDAVKASFGKRAFAWPNIYFDGYFPTVGYMYAPDGTKVTGPLSDYHFEPILHAWAADRDPGETWAELNEGRAPGLSLTPAEDAFSRLKIRERRADLRISDFLIERFRHQQLFYSMNHPSNEVMIEMLKRMMTAIDVHMPEPRAITDAMRGFQYTLNAIRLPYFKYVKDRYMIPQSYGDTILGRTLLEQDGCVTEGHESAYYAGPELISAYYRVYDSCCDKNVVHGLHT